MSKLELTRARAITSDVLYAAALPESADANANSTRVCQFYQGKWGCVDVDIPTQRIALFRRAEGGRIAVYMSPKGQMFSPEPSFRSQSISDGRLASSKKLGRLADLRQIGSHLVACGEGGQTYRQSDDGAWAPIDLTLFDESVDSTWVFSIRAPNAKTFAEEDAYWESHAAEKAELDRRVALYMSNLALHAIDGPSTDKLYVCGKDGRLFYWNGVKFTELLMPTSSYLLDILVEDEKTIWVCGRDGTLLRGNAQRGFTSISCEGQPQFSTMAKFKDLIFLSSYAQPRGIFVYDGRNVRRVASGMPWELDDVHTVDAVEGALWAIGSRSIARFDGTAWERIPMPA